MRARRCNGNGFRRLIGAMLLSGLGALSCQHPQQNEVEALASALSTDFIITLRTPPKVPVTGAAIAVENSLLIGPLSVVKTGGADRSVITNLGIQSINSDSSTTLGEVWSASAVILGSLAHVTGTVHAAQV